MDLLKPFRKCFYCKGKKDLLWVQTVDMYSSSKYFFHPYCLRQILKDPELYEKFVDRAVEIADIIDKSEKRKELTSQRYQELREKYKNF